MIDTAEPWPLCQGRAETCPAGSLVAIRQSTMRSGTREAVWLQFVALPVEMPQEVLKGAPRHSETRLSSAGPINASWP